MARPILAIGGAAVDRVYICANEPAAGTSNPVSSRRGFGGVARNVAQSLGRLGATVGLISATGSDPAGHALAADLAASGVDTSGILTVIDQPTAEYTAAFWQGELFAGFADMAVLATLTPDALRARLPPDAKNWLVFADCNLPAASLAMLAGQARKLGFPLAIDAVSVAKALRLPADLAGLTLFLNRDQAKHLGGLQALQRCGAQAVVLTQGADGVTLLEGPHALHLAAPMVTITNVSGAGDALIAGTLLAWSENRPLAQAVRYGLAAAALALQTVATVPADLTRAKLEAELARMAASQGPSHAT